MSAMANTTPIVTTVTKPATNPGDADATPRVNIQDFYEEYYEDILPIIMDKVRRDKRKEVHASDRHVLNRLGHRRQSVFDRLSETYSLSTTKYRPGRTNSRDHPRGRSRPHRLDPSNEGHHEDKERFCGIGESYDDSHSYSYHDRDRSRHMKRRRDSESPLSSVSKSNSSDGRYQKSKSKRHKPTDEDDLTMPWMCEEAAALVKRWVMPIWCHMFHSTLIGAARVWFNELPPEIIDSYKDLKVAFLAYFMQQKKYVKDPVEIYNIKQKDRETIKDFMECFKVETECMKGAPECMQISGFMHGVNNPKLTKRLNEHVPKTMEEMMITTIAFIRGEAAVASKKKGHTSWRTHDQEITFSPLTTSSGAEGPLVIEAKIGRHMIHHMYVDRGSSMEILYEHCFNRLQPEVKNQMVLATTSLTGFSGETIWPLGLLRLLVTIRDADHSTRAWMNFMIVRSLSPYNGIIERPKIKEIQAVPSTAHGMLKFPVNGEIVTIRSTILIPAECATVITSSEVPQETAVRHKNFKVALHPNFSDQEVAIAGMLSAKRHTKLCSLLKENLNIFAWQPSDMTGALERAKAIQAEVQKLVEAGIMRDDYYHDWLSNPVMVKKNDDSWRMCMDFTDLNKACPQDCYPLPKIDWKVESLCGYPFKCFLDAYKGYHQIQLTESDEEKMAFHTGQGVYCYTKTPFGLKNAGATCQRLVDKAFDSQIGQNIEVYVDDLVVKSHTEAEMLRDIGETFPEQAFKQLKQHLSELPLLVAPKPKEELIVYLFASYGAISVVLMTERGMVQTPVYFVSRALQGPKLNYTPMEKLVLSLVFAAKRLRSVILGQHNITYRPRTSVKGQVLADFLAEIPDESQPDASVVETQQEPWTLFMDGSSYVDGFGAGFILTSLEGTKFTYALRFQFAASNNEAEHEALIAGLRIAAQIGV
nr:reverse transcriptase domain-containing protein [Tanacetum cinerariifolium]